MSDAPSDSDLPAVVLPLQAPIEHRPHPPLTDVLLIRMIRAAHALRETTRSHSHRRAGTMPLSVTVRREPIGADVPAPAARGPRQPYQQPQRVEFVPAKAVHSASEIPKSSDTCLHQQRVREMAMLDHASN